MLLIENQIKLDQACDIIKSQNIIAIDTEFERRDTYFAKLALIQIATKEQVFLIDTLSDLDLSSIKEILIDEKIVKILHAPQQDLEIFWHKFGKLPKNMFDTQLAANFCGIAQNISYVDICWKLRSVKIDKTHQTSDWTVRPIPASQLKYAAVDVEYLFAIYDILKAKLKELGRLEEYNHAILNLLQESNFKIDYARAWQKVRFHERNPDFITIMQHLSAFREECAVVLNVPRKYIATDFELIELCKKLPVSGRELDRLGLQSRYLKQGKYRKKLLELCASLKEVRELSFNIKT
jgi:ribonuclease D